MDIRTNEQTTTAVYEPPMLVELGEFNEDTLGAGGRAADSLFQEQGAAASG
ncbi:MAG: lasso RiPP family leader peptide-containing protein [Pseudonocardiaceae bacterium]